MMFSRFPLLVPAAFSIVLLVAGPATALCAESAEEILKRCVETYATAESVSVKAATRVVMLKKAEITDTKFTQYELFVRQPKELLFVSDFSIDSASSALRVVTRNSSGVVRVNGGPGPRATGNADAGPGGLSYIERLAPGDRLIKQLRIVGLQGLRPGFEGTGFKLLEDPSAHKITFTNSAGSQVFVWIDKESHALRRVVTRGAVNAGVGTLSDDTMRVSDTVYRESRIGGNSDSMNLDNPEAQLTYGSPDRFGFDSIAALLAATSPEAANKAAGASAEANKIQGQAMSAVQMGAVVLIEGDAGSGSGFMTTIKGADFVVTNLHVIGGHTKFKVTTLAGEEIPVLGIFGAVGSDIAILRIAKAQGDLRASADVLKSSKIGDRVVVVGNRRGGGVATQVSGAILGIGPNKVEIDANFEPGNSGSPIFNVSTGEVIGVASYAATRRFKAEETGGAEKVEKRWFGFRIDSVVKWEAIDLVRFRQQAERIERFRELSESLAAAYYLDGKAASRHPKVAQIYAELQSRLAKSGTNGASRGRDFKDFCYNLRAVAEAGIKEFAAGDFYDYFKTCLYWDNSVSLQREFREDLVKAFKAVETDVDGYLARKRNGG